MRNDVAVQGPSTDAASMASFWALLGRLSDQKPFKKRALEAVLGMPLERCVGTNAYDVFEAGDIVADGVALKRVELRAKKGLGNVGRIVLEIDPQVMPLTEIAKRYASLATQSPETGDPPNTTFYGAALSWGRVSFGVSPREPAWVSHIVVNAS